MNESKYAVFLDIDNTLYYHGEVPQANIDAINSIRKEGHYVFINTARSFACIPNDLKKMLSLDGYVAGIGTDLRLGDKQIFSRTMTLDELKLMAELFLNDEREVVFEGEDTMIYISPQYAVDVNILKSAEDFETVYRENKFSKMYVRGQLTQEEKDILSKDFTVFQHAYYAEFVKKGYNKATGMQIMLDHIGIPQKNCIAMGDSANDEDMLKFAGISVAMGNSIPEIKAICDYVSCDAKDGGVAEALNHFILNNT